MRRLREDLNAAGRLLYPATLTSAEEGFCKASVIEPGCSPRNKSLKTRTGKKELGAAAKCNVTGLVTRESLAFNPFRSSCIVTLAFSTIIF